MEIMIFGAGYVGLVTGAGLASTGNHTVLADTLLDRIQLLQGGKTPIYEPRLDDLIQKASQSKNIDFVHTGSADFQSTMEAAEIYFIAVGTPENASGTTDLSYVLSVVDLIAKHPGEMRDKIVVVKSTVPVGTGDRIEKELAKKKKFPVVVSNPEFLKQGNAVQDFLKPERVIVGTDDAKARETLSFLYHPFMLKRDRIVCMSRRSAELVKYACNTFLATKISFINELSRLAEAVQADIREVREGMISDSRIGDQFLFPGVGYGGSCFPKDVHSLIAQGKEAGIELLLPMATDRVNKIQRLWPLEKLKKHLNEDLKGRTVALWGLSFKPNTDDLREAPSVDLIEHLLSAGAVVRAYDPVSNARMKNLFESAVVEKKLILCSGPYEAAEQAEALVILTEWQEFRTPHFKKLASLMKHRLILDGRNIYDSEVLKSQGFKHIGVGLK